MVPARSPLSSQSACLHKIKMARAIDLKARTRHATLWHYPVCTSVFTTSLSTLSVDLPMTPADVWHLTATARRTRWITKRQQDGAEALLETRRTAWHVRRRLRSESRSHCVSLVSSIRPLPPLLAVTRCDCAHTPPDLAGPSPPLPDHGQALPLFGARPRP